MPISVVHWVKSHAVANVNTVLKKPLKNTGMKECEDITTVTFNVYKCKKVFISHNGDGILAKQQVNRSIENIHIVLFPSTQYMYEHVFLFRCGCMRQLKCLMKD